jgi:hypothetical protein
VELIGRSILLRVVKHYPQARNHIYVGTVVARDDQFVTVDGSVFHFGRPTSDDPTGGLTVSKRALRWVPIARIQYIRELPAGVDPHSPRTFRLTADGNLSVTASERPDLIPD